MRRKYIEKEGKRRELGIERNQFQKKGEKLRRTSKERTKAKERRDYRKEEGFIEV